MTDPTADPATEDPATEDPRHGRALGAWNAAADDSLEVLSRVIDICELVVGGYGGDAATEAPITDAIEDAIEDLGNIAAGDSGPTARILADVNKGLAVLARVTHAQEARRLRALVILAKAQAMQEMAAAVLRQTDLVAEVGALRIDIYHYGQIDTDRDGN